MNKKKIVEWIDELIKKASLESLKIFNEVSSEKWHSFEAFSNLGDGFGYMVDPATCNLEDFLSELLELKGFKTGKREAKIREVRLWTFWPLRLMMYFKPCLMKAKTNDEIVGLIKTMYDETTKVSFVAGQLNRERKGTQQVQSKGAQTRTTKAAENHQKVAEEIRQVGRETANAWEILPLEKGDGTSISGRLRFRHMVQRALAENGVETEVSPTTLTKYHREAEKIIQKKIILKN